MKLFLHLVLVALPLLATAPASFAQDVRSGFLVHQDSSDCQNNDVREPADAAMMNGTVVVSRAADGKTSVKIGLSARPNTTYHFFLKCVRHLDDIQTNEEGTAVKELTLNPGEGGSIIAFDMYPEGAPAGNKFQSTPIKF